MSEKMIAINEERLKKILDRNLKLSDQNEKLKKIIERLRKTANKNKNQVGEK